MSLTPEEEKSEPEELKNPVPAGEFAEEEEDEEGADEMNALMEQYLDRMPETHKAGQTLTVPIVALRQDHALIDVGEKAEGIVDLKELLGADGRPKYSPGDVIEVIVKGQDPESGLLYLSHAEAMRRRAQEMIRDAIENNRTIEGTVQRVVKGGLLVDIGTLAFLPASQLDRRRVEKFEEWIGRVIECAVIEHNPENRRIVLSRRKVMEERERAEREAAINQLEVGRTIKGRVKKIEEFGAFVDLGGMDGLIPRSEISWTRNARPGDIVRVGEEVEVAIIGLDPAQGKVTLSRKQMTADPWESAAERYPKGAQCEGVVVSLTNYGAFVRLDEGLDGMVHISDMSWDSTAKSPGAYVAAGQTLQVSVLNVDLKARRISLGLKQLTNDPWENVESRFPAGARLKGPVTGLTKFGAFVELDKGVEGMIHISDFSWDKQAQNPRDFVNKGDEIEVCVLKVDAGQRRISLGVKQLTESPISLFQANNRVGKIIEAEISNVTETGVFVNLGEKIEGFIHVSQLDRGRVENPKTMFKAGEMIQAEITKIDEHSAKVSLNRRKILVAEEKKTMKAYVNQTMSSGTNLGELLSELSLEDKSGS